MATHSHILAWRIPSTGDWRATLHRIAELDTTEEKDKYNYLSISLIDK